MNENIKRIIKNCQVEDINAQFLQCGSSIKSFSARDIDIMVYICDDLHTYFTRLLERVEDKHIIKKSYINIWKMYSLKFIEDNEIISFHIVSFEDLKRYVKRADEIEIYANINLFELSLNLPTVYRKWINETRHLCGNSDLKAQLEIMLQKYKMPVIDIQDLLRKRIINSINYYFEKEGSDLFSGIVIAQIFNDIALYCYAGNNKFYGTLKYIESDLKSFKNCVKLSKQSVELFKSINRTEENDITKRLYSIKETLLQKNGE